MTTTAKMQNPEPGNRSPSPPPTTADKIQDDNKGGQDTPSQGGPKPKSTGEISCSLCSYTCHLYSIFRAHFRSVHNKKPITKAQGFLGGLLFLPLYNDTICWLKPVTTSCDTSERRWQQSAQQNTAQNALQKAAKQARKRNRKNKPGNLKGKPNFQPGNRKKRPPRNFLAGQQRGRTPPNIQSGSVPRNSGRHIIKLKDYVSRADREPLIGLEYVLEYRLNIRGNQIEIKYFCELCECDADVDPMVEHLAGFRHRKLYLARVYPYVLKAQASSKEDQSRFIRRMALEIEREEGAKKYMVDNSIWMESMMTLRAADKRMIERRTRWEERTDPTRMKKALNYLGMFEIESEIEATTVTRLCEKLTANLRVYSNYPRQDALFPARVVRAQDVVKSLLQNAVKQRTCVQNPMQKKEKPQAPPKFNKRPPPHPENASLRHKAGMQRGHPGANSKNINARENMPTKPPYKQAQKYPSGPLKKRQEKTEPSMPQRKETPQKAEKPDQSFLKNISQEDTQFFKKLMALLDVLPRSVSPPETTEDSSNLLMLKSLLAKEKNAEHEQANSKMMMQIASIMQDTLSAQNASLNQQLMLMTSQNSTAMVMQTASTGGFVPGIHGLGTVQANVNSLMPFNQSFASQTYGQMEVNASGPTNPNAYQGPMQSYSGPPQSYSGPPQSYSGPPQSYSGPPQNCDDFGYGNSMVGNYVAQGNPNDTQHDGIDNSLTTRQNERKRIPHTDVDYESSAPETRYADRSEEDAAYTRVRLSPSSRRIPYDSNDDTRREIRTQDQRRRERSRSYSADGWDEQEEDMRYSKRPRLGMDNQSHRSESVTDQLLESLGINSADIPPELLRRIQGKDLFTASAIISEYSESRFGK